ncbi:type II toxin-antitoxin system Phd/YefM family antitoxin [Nostoc sp. XA010]|uniref:type II toxin-antitoxin system Phd/YefM family antitoxin n=1 Tax=Nostoc sp. XA010 TaxID=2780407 RepID=UPI001E4B3D5D|nr:type II toxin-antitoxin system Phd/YefM family antitoxin [Nostoc sp. XA010]MCC5658711.1 type II toxin-antitoxin system Phd/YefM family antitoxin [Nostoc sp. XA010]
MSQQYSIEQVPKNLDKIFQRIEQGESVQITQQGQQVAMILPAAEYQRLLHRKPGFWKSVERFRQELMEEGTEIDSDEVWKDVRDKSPAREIVL